MISRRHFLQLTGAAWGATSLEATALPFSLFPLSTSFEGQVMTVNGPIAPAAMGTTLVHEHVLVDFVGADQVSPDRYDTDEAFDKILPYLKEIQSLGCQTLMECTPNYLGRDVKLLKRLSEATGLQILTNTGYYGARSGKFLPPSVATQTPQQIAQVWIQEFEQGINGTGIRPGFIKIGVDDAPLPEYNRKIVEAAALTHLQTGLTIAAHTGTAAATQEELAIVQQAGVSPEAFIWVHAQNAKTPDHVKAAEAGAWVEIDGISQDNYANYAQLVKALQQAGFLSRVLVSCDAGWYRVGEPNGGEYRSYAVLFEQFIPELKRLKLSEADITQLLVTNPAKAFPIRVRSL